MHLAAIKKDTVSSFDADGGFGVLEVEGFDCPYTNATILVKYP